MSIYVKKANKSTSKNKVYLINKIANLKDLDLSARQKTYFKEVVKEDQLSYTNEAGVFTFICLYANLDQNKGKENTRKFGDSVYEVAKNQCTDLCIISDSSEAVELFAEGLSLSSYSLKNT